MEGLNGGRRKILEPPSDSPGGSQEETTVGGNKDPLQIPEIRDMICSYIVDVGDLKNVRAVDKMWRDETRARWRESVVFLISDETIPILVKAFEGGDDPFELAAHPFTKYRFVTNQGWAYPLGSSHQDLEKKLIWEKCINPNATYLDVRECFLDHVLVDDCTRPFEWILRHSSKITELAFAPALLGNGSSRRHNNASTFQALQLTSLTISNPKLIVGNPFFDDLLFHLEAATDVIEMLPNLKTLKFGNGIQAREMTMLVLLVSITNSTHLESISGLQLRQRMDSRRFGRYLESHLPYNPALRELQVRVLSRNVFSGIEWGSQSVKRLQKTLTKLEMEVDCESYEETLPSNPRLFLEECEFSNLTQFKVQIDYETFHLRNGLLTFNLYDLKKMPKLREFHLGTKTRVEKTWVTQNLNKKLNFFNGNAVEEKTVDFQLPSLKSFHFHGNFKTDGLQQLGKIAMNLKTLELVFDQANFNRVMDIWPRLKNLKILMCSDVPEEAISNTITSNAFLLITDDSKNWTAMISK